MFLMTICSVWLGVVVRNVTHQRRAIRALSAIPETRITFNHQIERGTVYNPNAELTIPKWLRRSVGDDFFQTVGSVAVCDAKLDEAILRQLTKLRGLRGLAIRNSTVAAGGGSQIGRLKDLEWLVLNNVTFEDDTWSLPIGSHDLSVLHITDTSVNAASYKRLASFRTLVHLTLDGVPATDTELESLRRLDKIDTVNLSRSCITDLGLPIFAQMTALRSLTLSETNVTDAGVAALRRQRMDILVTYDHRDDLSEPIEKGGPAEEVISDRESHESR